MTTIYKECSARDSRNGIARTIRDAQKAATGSGRCSEHKDRSDVHLASTTALVRELDLECPMGEDSTPDRALVTSARRMNRVATVAAEVGARFARERIDVDPVAWLSAPRRMFGGRSAIDAVQNRKDFRRAMLLHSLSLGLDADVADLDVLLEDGDGVVRRVRSGVVEDEGVGGLFTAAVVDVTSRGSVYVFHARVARSRADFQKGLRIRLGATLAEAARIAEGFDPEEPIAAALVSARLEHTLVQVASDVSSPLAAGLDVLIEQRFAL